MKKFYSVKETARLLGVSTNTVYKYVDTGSLQVRRLGRGRIKIPHSSLSLLIDLPEPANQITVKTPVVQETIPVTPKVEEKVPTEESIKYAENDIIFFRVFRGLTLWGLGIIYLIDKTSSILSLGRLIEGKPGELLLTVIPVILILAGIVSIVFDFRLKANLQNRILVHIFNAIVFSFYVITFGVLGRYAQVVFLAPLAILAVSHLMRGITPTRKSNFYDEFLRYSTLTALMGGALIVVMPSYFPIPSMIEFVSANRFIFAIGWFVLFVVPMVYFQSPYGRKSKAIPWFFVLWSAVTLVMATTSTIHSEWDIAFMSYLAAAFGVFFVFWHLVRVEIEASRLIPFLSIFAWIGLTSIGVIFGLKTSQEQLLRSEKVRADDVLYKSEEQINQIFANQKYVMTEFAGSPEMLKFLKEKDVDGLTGLSKQIFERALPASRVIIYDENGIAYGVYPVSSLTLGADFSSRDYFIVTKSTYKNYITPIYGTILGTQAVLQSEPIFEDNKFVGMIGIAINLETFSEYFRPVLPKGAELYLVDENGIVVYSMNKGEQGHEFKGTGFSNSNEKSLVTIHKVSSPRWTSYKSIPNDSIFSEIQNIHANLSILFLFNLIISLGIGFVAATTKYVKENQTKSI